jgi:protoporphyrinogen oxidase
VNANDRPVLILGAGPTGLATAIRLAQAGRKVKLIERLPWAGGLCQTYTRGPFKLDLGPHRFTPHNKEVNDFVHDMLKGDLITVKYKAQIWLGDRFIQYPFSLGNLLTKIPPAMSAKLISTYLLALAKTSAGNEKNYQEWVLSHFGSEVTRLVFNPLIGKVWGTPLTQLSPRFARQRIAIASLWEIAWEVLTGKRPEKFRSPFYPDNHFLYPRQGFGFLMDQMAAAFQAAGGELICDATVKEFQIAAGTVAMVAYEKDGQRVEERDPSYVMTTIPIQYFFDIVKPTPAPGYLAAAKQLKTRRLILLYLTLNKDYFSDNTSLYFPSSEFICGRVWEQKNHSLDTVNVKGKTVLGIEVPCWETDEIWKADDAFVFEKAFAAFERHGLLKRAEVEEFFTVRLGSVYPVWDINYEANLGKLLEYERGVENLLFNGRPGLFFYNNLHHSLDMGFVAARHILSGQSKAQKWDQDAQAFKEFQLVE